MRRKEYDNLYGARKEKAADPNASANFFSTFANMFGASSSETKGATPVGRPDADNVFADAFEEVCCTEYPNIAVFLTSHFVIASFYVQKLNVMHHGGLGLVLFVAEE